MSTTESARPASAGAAPPPSASVGAVVGLLILFEMTSGFLQGGIAPLLPDIGTELGMADADLNWVVAAQLLAAAVSVPAFGRLGDVYGHRLMLRVSLICVAVGSLLVAFAPSLPVLLAGRVLLGPLAALLPLEIALVRDRLSVERARAAIARLVGALTLGTLLGGVVMGLAHKATGDVRITLLLPAALAVLCVPVSFLAIPESTRAPGARLDWPGVGLLSLAMLLLLAGISAAKSGPLLSGAVLVPIPLALLTGAVWAVRELRVPDPLVDLRALADRSVAPYFLCAAAFGVVYFGSMAPDSTFLAADPDLTGYGFGLSALAISLIILPAGVAAVIGSSLTARIAGRLGYRPALIASFALIGASFLATAAFHTAIWQLVAAKVLAGAGIGVALGALPTVIAEAGAPSRTGITTALYNNVKTLGGAIAGAVIAVILATPATETGSAVADAEEAASESGYVAVWLLCALLSLGAAAAAAFARRGARP
ncbi:Predicted arabinose efflux permease, MFS family [Streptomyces sp. 2131.1]|uniref:MFS transporter n=1 Tax=Streptomyces sp. 2131.1 TaxID=1855346 RepID=UPI0008951E10|nr:MFS transporter [Streptomyces sp. 2131.1]SEE34856.1 Predicted arabinose efflux permease, MFS family [Streptomyces sp. 2131.1]